MEQHEHPISKECLGKYLHDMIQLESESFTIEQTVLSLASSHRNEPSNEELQNKLDVCEQEIDKLKVKIKHAKEKKRQALEKRTQEFEKETKTNWVALILLFIFTLGIGLIIYFIYENFHVRSVKKDFIAKCEQDKAHWNGIIADYKKKLTKKKQEKQEIEEQLSPATLSEDSPQNRFRQGQIQFAQEKVKELRAALDTLYAYNIIPEEYRSLDCLISLSQMLKIELADTIEDATRLYDQKVFNGEIMVGIKSIYAQKERLAEIMPYMAKPVTEIAETVEALCEDVYQLSQNAQEAQETKLSLYAIQALQESKQRLAWCEEQRRLGNI